MPSATRQTSPRFIETVPKRGYRFIATLIPTPAATVVSQPIRRSRFWRVAAFLIVLVAFGLAANRYVHPRPAAPGLARPVAPNETRLTFGSGLQTEPAWSPDGRMVAYASAVSGNRDIWVQPIAGGEAIQLTKSAAMEWEPAWAGDDTIAFRVEGSESGIYAMQGLGGPPQRLTTFGILPKWSPDSRLLLFGSTGEGLGVRHGLFLVRRDGRPPVRILERETEGLEDVGPWVWHPDSRRVSFVGSRPGDTYRLYTATHTGGALIETAIPDEVRADVFYVLGSIWSPDGGSLIVHGLREDETSSLWRLLVNPHTLQTRGVDRLKSGGSVIEAPVLNPSGSSIAYGRPSDSRRLWRVPLDATGTRVIAKGTPITDESAWVVTSDLSPDGRTIVCTLRFAGSERGEVRLVAADTGESRTLVSDA